MPLDPRRFERCLQTKFGFEEDTGRESGHRYYKLQVDELLPVRTKVSHGRAEIHDGLVTTIARQLCVTRSYLMEMIECTKTKQEYEDHLRANPPAPRSQRFI